MKPSKPSRKNQAAAVETPNSTEWPWNGSACTERIQCFAILAYWRFNLIAGTKREEQDKRRGGGASQLGWCSQTRAQLNQVRRGWLRFLGTQIGEMPIHRSKRKNRKNRERREDSMTGHDMIHKGKETQSGSVTTRPNGYDVPINAGTVIHHGLLYKPHCTRLYVRS